MKTFDNLHIDYSFRVVKKDFDGVLDYYHQRGDHEVLFASRSFLSLKLEWAAHNFLYDLGIAVDRTRDVDLQTPRKWYEPIFYAIVGGIGWIFID